MIKLQVIDKVKKTFLVEKGTNLLDYLRKKGYLLSASCGGKGICKKCIVNCNGQSVISCQTIIDKDMTVVLDQKISDVLTSSYNSTYPIKPQEGYGIAIDIGTTTVAMYLINLNTGNEMDCISFLNPQVSYGADVITRIEQCMNGNLENLHLCLIEKINEVLHIFKYRHQIAIIKKMMVAGNPTMLHLFLKIDPSPIGIVPFTPVFLEKKELVGSDFNLSCEEITILPSISGYLGSDIIAGMVSCNMIEQNNSCILIDIGTNGEIILKTNDIIYGCSTAAGPAFEGARIEMGMAAVSGAISKVQLLNSKLNIDTIYDALPRGICGSGLIDIIAILLKEGFIDESGYLCENRSSSLNDKLKKDRFYLTDQIFLTQKDIREFQLAKSAIHAGILTILSEAEVDLDNIGKIYIAGGFGFYLNKENALTVGLLPGKSIKKIAILGNASGVGAKMALLNHDFINQFENISRSVKIVELANNTVFMNNYIEQMFFKELIK